MWIVLPLLTFACGDGSGVVVHVVMDAYSENPFPVRASSDNRDIRGALDDLNCSLTGGTCSVEFGPPRYPTVVQFLLAADSSVSFWFRARVLWGGECEATGLMGVHESREYVCEASLFWQQGLSPRDFEEARIVCGSTGPVCTPRYKVSVRSDGRGYGTVGLTMPQSLCGPLAVRMFIGDSLAASSPAVGPLEGIGVSFSSMHLDSTYHLSVEAEAPVDGCHGPVLARWKALVQMLYVVQVE